MVLLHAVESVFSIVFMISLGYILTRRKWFSTETSQVFAKLVTTVALPCFMLWNLTTTFDRASLFGLAGGLVVPLFSMSLCYAIGFVISRAIQVEPDRRGTFRTMYFMSNTIFIGLPVNLALFGEQSVPYVLLYYIVNTSLFWTLGVYGISRDGAGETKLWSLDTLKNICSPPLVGFVLAVLLIIIQVPVPKFVLDTCKYLGNLTTPLSMLFIGIALYQVKIRNIRISVDMVAIVIGRFVVSPLTVLLFATIWPIPDLMKKVFIIQAAMPVMTQTAIVSKAYEADSEYAAVMTAVTNVLSMVAIPVFMVLLD